MLFLRSLADCTVFPDESILVISGIGSNEKFWNNFIASYDIPNLRLITREQNFTQDSNRNVGASASNYAHISFFDCDDYLHPQRFEILKAVFKEQVQVDHVLHTFSDGPPSSEKLGTIITYSILYSPADLRQNFFLHARNDSSYWSWCCAFMPKDEYTTRVHNGWGTMKRDVFKKIPQVRGPLPAVEDSIHNSKIIREGYNVMVLKDSLGLYLQGRRNTSSGQKDCSVFQDSLSLSRVLKRPSPVVQTKSFGPNEKFWNNFIVSSATF
jgi:glycosyltransferase involved in cell wall biosynthesis